MIGSDWLVSFTRDLSVIFTDERTFADHEEISNSRVGKAYLSFLLESVNSRIRFSVDLLSTSRRKVYLKNVWVFLGRI